MALKDYKWFLEGTHEVVPGLTLKDVTITIDSVDYKANTRIATNRVDFVESEGVYTHQRELTFPLADNAQESISAENIKAFIQHHFPTAQLISE